MRETNRSPRRADAARNDERIFAAAREVFGEQGYEARMSAIADRAGVGVGTLYGRYASKERLIERMSIAGMHAIADRAEAAAAEEGDAWASFSRFMRECVDEGAGLGWQLAGTFQVSDEQVRASARVRDALESLLARVKAEGGLNTDIVPADIYLIFAQLRAVRHGPALRRRHLAIMLAGLRAPAGEPLPGPHPDWAELQRHWGIPDR